MQVGQTAAQHDHLRIDQIDDMGQAARQPVLVAIQRGQRRRLASLGAGLDFLWGYRGRC